VEQGKREKLLETMLEELGEKGYGELSLADALARAGVSEAEFEAEFAGKDECLFAAYDQLTGRVVKHATAGCGNEETWPRRVRGGLATLLGEIAAEPEMARVVTRSFPGIRPSTYERYVDLLSRFVPYMREGREYSEVDEELPGEVELLAVGAAEAIIFAEVDAGRAQRLPAMMPEILFSVLVPFIGPDRAAEEMRSASPAG
jgi:AcrR family transcriptional regulator